MNVAELITGMKQLTANQTNATFTDAWYLDRLNQGYRQLTTFRDPTSKTPLRFPHFQTTRDKTISGLSTNLFPLTDADIFAVTSFYDLTNSRPVPEVNIREIEEADPTLTGTIQKYAIVGTGTVPALRLWRFPTSSVSVRLGVYLYPEALVAGGVGPVIPLVWHRGVELWGAAEVADKQGMPTRRDELLSQAVAHVRATRTATQETRRKRRYLSMGRQPPSIGMSGGG